MPGVIRVRRWQLLGIRGIITAFKCPRPASLDDRAPILATSEPLDHPSTITRNNRVKAVLTFTTESCEGFSSRYQVARALSAQSPCFEKQDLALSTLPVWRRRGLMPLVVRTIPRWTATSDKWKRNYCTQAICGRALEKQSRAILICRISALKWQDRPRNPTSGQGAWW